MTTWHPGGSDEATHPGTGGDAPRLAPVTYLPGVRPPADQPGAAPDRASGRQRDVPTLASVFGELGDDPSGWADDRAERSVADGADALDPDVELDDDELDDPEESTERQVRRAENVSMHALTRRAHSRRELERTLLSRDLHEGIVADELDRLERVGLIDDQALAQQLVGTLQERKGLGRSAIAAELTKRLLAPSAIEYALELVDSGDELARAREIAVKRAGQLRGLDREVAVRRLSAFLLRRGYSGSTVRTAVDAALPWQSGRGRSTSGGVRFQ